jgi:biotin carboxyl carrier protein
MKFKIIILILTFVIFTTLKLNSTHENNYVNISDISDEKCFQGYIIPRNRADLSFQTDGKISFMPYKEGDFVQKGEVLARLDGFLYRFKKEKINLGNEINYNIITSPYDGYIGKIYKQPGKYIKRKEPVLELYATNKTEAEILVDAKYINKINLKENAFLEYKDSQYEAKIANILKNEDKYIVKLQLYSLFDELKDGTCVNVKMKLNK